MKAEYKRLLKNIVSSLPHIKKKKEKYISYIRGCYDYTLPTPTIICSTCIGGMISHNLGLKFMSPTVNIWMIPSDLVKFVSDLDRYLNAKIEFKKSDDYPVGKLLDITVYFQHYTSNEEAENKWNERKTRIDRENLYIITDDKRLSEEEIEKLKKVNCKRLIIFTVDGLKKEPFFAYDCYKGEKEIGFYSVRDLKGFAPFEKEFNYAAWLSGAKDYRIRGEK